MGFDIFTQKLVGANVAGNFHYVFLVTVVVVLVCKEGFVQLSTSLQTLSEALGHLRNALGTLWKRFRNPLETLWKLVGNPLETLWKPVENPLETRFQGV